MQDILRKERALKKAGFLDLRGTPMHAQVHFWTPQGAEATRSGGGKKVHPGVHRGEPNRKGSNKQIAAKQDCYNQPEATTIL